MRASSRRVDAGVEPDVGRARVQQHHDLLERRVARALADAVDRALDLARAGQHAGERVGDRQPEVVVAVDREHDVAQAGHQLVEPRQEVRVLVRHRVADGVGDVDRRRALVERDLQHLGGELDVGARGVHRRELDVVAQRACACATAARAWPLTSSRVDCSWWSMWMSDVEMNVWMRGRSASRTASHARSMSAAWARARPAMTGPCDLAGDRLHRLEVAGRGDREAGLDHVDAQARELMGDLELLGRCSARCPGDCSPSRSVVSKMMTRSVGGMSLPFLGSLLVLLRLGVRLRRPPRAIPPEGGGGEARRPAGATCAASYHGPQADEHDLADVAALGEQPVRLGARGRTGRSAATTGRIDAGVEQRRAAARSTARACRGRPTA